MDDKQKTDIEAVNPVQEPQPVVGEIKDLNKADAALEFLRQGHDVPVMKPEDERRLKRKVDWRIVPLMLACYLLQYLDKTLINYANVMGLQKDTGITGNQYSQLAMIFYVSYLCLEFPHSWGIQRFPTAKYIGIMVTLWGLILACTSACSNWAGLVTTRVLLGVFESAIAPSLIVITAMWYKRHEQPPRMGIWYLGTGKEPRLLYVANSTDSQIQAVVPLSAPSSPSVSNTIAARASQAGKSCSWSVA